MPGRGLIGPIPAEKGAGHVRARLGGGGGHRQGAEGEQAFRRELAEPPGSAAPGPGPQAPRPWSEDDGRPS